jgi:hypothetical protein
MNMVRWFFVGLLVVFLAGCSSSKKEGEACKRNAQCDGLMVCYKETSKDEIGKCMKASQARALYEKKKEEK